MTEDEARQVLAGLLGQLRVLFTRDENFEQPVAFLSSGPFNERELEAVTLGLARMRETGVPL